MTHVSVVLFVVFGLAVATPVCALAQSVISTHSGVVCFFDGSLKAVHQLHEAGLAQLAALGETLHSRRHEIAAMWHFTRNNGITEGFHTKLEVLSLQAYGFRNFSNYRSRVETVCS